MRVNEVPASSGYGEPFTKFFKTADQVKVIAAVGTDARFTPADWPAKKDVPGGPYLLVAASNGNVLRLPLAAYRSESTKVGRRYVKLDEGDRAVMARLVRDEDGVMLASRNGYVIHFPVEQVNILSGVGKGVMGIKLDDGDACLGGTLVMTHRRNDANRLGVETESGRAEFFTPERPKSQNRAGKGDKPWARTKFARVLPPAIELVNWDEVEEKAEKKAAHAEKNGESKKGLFD
jgi:DNA gyrase subunit A